LKIFLDTSLLSDTNLSTITEQIVEHVAKGDQFYVSIISHFQILWGYHLVGKSAEKYEEFLKSASIEIPSMTKTDVEEAAGMKPSKSDLLDALIASNAKKYDGIVWSLDKDFLKFLPKSKVRLFRST
jgi:predicted nucleic acid-binding protein